MGRERFDHSQTLRLLMNDVSRGDDNWVVLPLYSVSCCVAIPGTLGAIRIAVWQGLALSDYGPHWKADSPYGRADIGRRRDLRFDSRFNPAFVLKRLGSTPRPRRRLSLQRSWM
jgi:hypothetical protein